MQQGDYGSAPYYQPPYGNVSNPNPSPNYVNQSTGPYASAPPFSTTSYSPADYAGYPSNYPPYPQNPHPVPAPPTAPAYAPQPNPSLNLPPSSSFIPSHQRTTPDPTSSPSSFPGFESHGTYQPPAQQPPQSYYSPPTPSYDQPPPTQQVLLSYSAPISATHNLNSNATSSLKPGSFDPPYSSMHTSSAPYDHPPPYGSSYPNSSKLDQGSSYFDERYGNYGRSSSSLGSELYGKRPDTSVYDSGRDDLYGDGVYAYQGEKMEPYVARGTGPKSSTRSGFDDYGRAISFPPKESSSGGAPKITRAVPKVEVQQDVMSSIQKFRVKLLPESGSQSNMDVLCQIGLDGIKMLDPSTNRMLRIYPLENLTRCEVCSFLVVFLVYCLYLLLL
ncbi:hypothetical protein SAY86_011403 [Trapa natans]|uniref:Uncharacterized protein n=1 Tax=Trapa natans TaxID=22666 RepID=A0AAN7LU70_TRANT|nr:hypothetical protein SAY86_011403 [Trapa natans]